MTRSAWLVGMVTLAMVPGAWAHGDLDTRIAAKTAVIAAEPGRAILYFERGQLYAQHREWDAARADFQESERLDPGLPALDVAIGEAYLQAGEYAAAAARFDAHLRRQPGDAATLTGRARARRGAGDFAGAVADYAQALAAVAAPTPELYIECADALAAAGQVAAAIHRLDAAQVRLGPIVTLQGRALALELQQGQTEAALARLEDMAAATPRPEVQLVRKGDVLAAAGRQGEAAQAYRAALAAISRLPPGVQATTAVQDLQHRATAALAGGGAP